MSKCRNINKIKKEIETQVDSAELYTFSQCEIADIAMDCVSSSIMIRYVNAPVDEIHKIIDNTKFIILSEICYEH